MANLIELLTNIANAIRSKKGTTEPINAQDFATEIESIEVGGGSNEIWTGTTLVSKEDVFIENIYANTQLTIPEVVDMLSKLDYLDVDDVNQTYIAFVGENQATQIGITRTLYQNEYVYNVMLVGDGDTYTLFLSKDIFEYGWEGFMPLITYPITINTHGYSNINGITIGTQNDLLSGLISSENNFKKVKKENALKKLLNTTQSAGYLFYEYKGTSVNDLIGYNDTENVTKTNAMFFGCSNIQTIPLINTSNVTNMRAMFYGCSSIQTIPFIDTSNVTEAGSMFYQCSNLTNVPELNLQKNTNGSSVFYKCSSLKNLSIIMGASNLTSVCNGCSNLEYVKFEKGTFSNLYNGFNGCVKLKTIDLHSLSQGSSSGMYYAFKDCKSLTKIIIRVLSVIPQANSEMFTGAYHFKGTVDETYNPEGLKDGKIYVPDNMVQKLKTATNWSVYADCIVPLSTLEE